MNSKTRRSKTLLILLTFVLTISIFYSQPVTVSATIVGNTQQVSSNYDRWMNVCGGMLYKMKKYNFKYSNSNTKSTFRSALNNSRRSNCALYVSWCLQQYGVLKPGQTFYVKGNGSIRKNFGSWGSKVQVIRINKRCSSAKLQPGDVVCWKGTAHSNIYAGKSSKGTRLWYDGGKVATASNRTGSRYKYTSKRALGYLNSRRISYVIRIKNV